MYTVSFLFVAGIAAVYGYPNGAPEAACNTLQPSHTQDDGQLAEAQTSDSPYKFSVDKTEVVQGNQVKVKVEGTNYQGFLLVAQKAIGNEFIGTFENPEGTNAKIARCKTGANELTGVTHTDTEAKTNLEFTWNAPSSFLGPVCFRGVVAEVKVTYWTIHGNATCVTVTAAPEETTVQPEQPKQPEGGEGTDRPGEPDGGEESNTPDETVDPRPDTETGDENTGNNDDKETDNKEDETDKHDNKPGPNAGTENKDSDSAANTIISISALIFSVCIALSTLN